MSGPDEFAEIARLFRPLTRGAPEAFDLLDDAAAIPSRPGFDLVVTKDALVAGVHFRHDEAPDIVAQRLLRANLSDLAAKAAEPYGYFLMTAWPMTFGAEDREAFAQGLATDGEAFGVSLLGGDTVVTPGLLTVSMTLMGWVPAGRMVRRAGARPGDLVMVSGPIGDGWIAWSGAGDPHRLPTPRLDLRDVLRAQAGAAADISDGLIADAGHIATASGCALHIDLDRMPVSAKASAWLADQSDRTQGLLRLATGGDDYEVVCTGSAPIPGFTIVGEARAGQGVGVSVAGHSVDPGPGGWRHL